jgi:phage terminase small subunit
MGAMTGPLRNARHERFAQERAKGRSVDAAYAKAGFKPNRGNAARLNAIESVAARIAELQSRAAEKAVVTVDDIAKQLDQDRAFARRLKQPAAAVSATLGKAKVLGLIVEKHDLRSSDGSMSPKEPTYKLVK